MNHHHKISAKTKTSEEIFSFPINVLNILQIVDLLISSSQITIELIDSMIV